MRNCCYPYMPYMCMYDDDEDLEKMYPEMYYKLYPMVKMHCDRIERKCGWMESPTDKDLKEACEDMYENIKDYLEEMDEDDKDDHDDDNCYSRQYSYDRRRPINDFLRILLIRELAGRRRRRRRRRPMPYYGYWY